MLGCGTFRRLVQRLSVPRSNRSGDLIIMLTLIRRCAQEGAGTAFVRTISILLTFLAVTTTLCVASVGASEWPGFRGPEGDGSVSTEDGRKAFGLQTRWNVDIGSGYAGMAVSGDMLVTAMQDGDVDVLAGLSTTDGSRRWSVTLGPKHVGAGGSMDGAISSPTIADGVAYAFGPKGAFVAVEVASGKEVWRRDLAEEKTTPPEYGFGSSPVVYGGLVIVQLGGDAGAVIAMERESGEIAWRSFASDVYAQSPQIIEIDGRSQLVFAGNEFVAGLDPEEGTLLWRWGYQGRSAFVLSNSPLPTGDGRFFFTPASNRGVLFDPPQVDGPSTLEEAPEPTIVWDVNALNRTYSPATVVGDLLIGYTSRFLSAFNVADGSRAWRSRAPGDGFLIAVNDQLLVVTKTGSLHLANVDDGWSEVDSVELFDEVVWTTPSYSDGSVYVRSMSEIARVDLVYDDENRRTRVTSTGSEQPQMPALARILAAPEAERAAMAEELLDGLETPIIAGDRAGFVWRGEADDVGIAGDFLGMRGEAAFERIEGTDLWWYETEIDPRVQYTYFLLVDYEHQLDPLNPKQARNSVMGYNANWVRGEPVPMSYFAGPEWPGLPEFLREDAPPVGRAGTWSTVDVEAPEDLPNPRMAQLFANPFDVWLPPGYDAEADRRYPTLYLFEWGGERDPDLGDYLNVLNRFGGERFEMPIVVAVDRPTPGPVAGLLVRAVDEAFRTRPEAAERAAVAHGFFGINALSMAAGESPLAKNFGIQTFFGFTDMVAAATSFFSGKEDLGDFTVYLEWGSLDTRSPSEGWDMRAASRELFETLDEMGVNVVGGQVVGSSDWKRWRLRTPEMLEVVLPLER